MSRISQVKSRTGCTGEVPDHRTPEPIMNAHHGFIAIAFLGLLTPTALADDAETRKALRKLGALEFSDDSTSDPNRPILEIWMPGGKQVTDAALKELQLSKLKSLQAFGLGYDTPVTDVGLQELRGLKSLERLELNATKVTDAGLKNLKELSALKSLTLSRTGVTDNGMKDLAPMGALESLNLRLT